MNIVKNFPCKITQQFITITTLLPPTKRVGIVKGRLVAECGEDIILFHVCDL